MTIEVRLFGEFRDHLPVGSTGGRAQVELPDGATVYTLVERKYYLKVSRFTNSGFLRLKFAKELEKRQLTSRVFETRREADHNIAGEHDR